MPSEKEKAEETVSPVSSGDKAPSKKESTAPASSKKDDKKEDELVSCNFVARGIRGQ